MKWIPFAFSAMTAVAAADLFIKLAAGKLSNSLAMLIYGSCTFLFGLGWVLWQRWFAGVPQSAQPVGVLAAVGVGVAFSAATLTIYLTFGAGAPVSIASPAIRLGALLLASVVGLTLLHEPLTWRYAIGMILAISGVYLIITR
jgi:drug/metabolite transporter (DMT)-like permease